MAHVGHSNHAMRGAEGIARQAARSSTLPSFSHLGFGRGRTAQAARRRLPIRLSGSTPAPAEAVNSTTGTVKGDTAAQHATAQHTGSGKADHHSAADASPATALTGFQLSRVHVAVFLLIFVGGVLFATATLQFTADMEFSTAAMTVLSRSAKSVAFRQLVVIGVAILLVRYCLNGALKAIASFTNSRVEWDKTLLFYILREVYQPLELLLLIAAICTVADTFVPSLISVSKSTVSRVVKTILSTSFILGFSSVMFNIKSRFCKENAWQAEMKGDVTQQRRWEAYDKLGTFVIYVMTFVLAIQAIGLEVTSVLAIGGIGGLAIGLAGREICENLLNGFLIMSTNPFEVGDEIHFFHSSKVVEGFVIDIGWYRTLIRSFEREVFVIPNSVFSKNIVLNITRKNREFRFFETLLIRVQDVEKANSIIQDIRRIVRNDTRTINKLHRRVFLDKITHEDCRIYMSFYLEAANRDAFMAIKQDMLLSFVDVVERNGAKLATPRTMVEMEKDLAEVIGGVGPMMAGIAAAQSMAQQGFNAKAKRLPEVSSAAAPYADTEATTVSSNGASSSNSGGSSSSSSGGASSSIANSSGSSGAASHAAPVASSASGPSAGTTSSTSAPPSAGAMPSSASGASTAPSTGSAPAAAAAATSTSSTSSGSGSGGGRSGTGSPSGSPAPSTSQASQASKAKSTDVGGSGVPSAQPSSSGGTNAMSLPQNVPAVPLSASPVAFSPIAVPQKPAAQPKGSSPGVDGQPQHHSDDLWGSSQPRPHLQGLSSATITGDVLLASFEDLTSIFENSPSYTDPDGYDEPSSRKEPIDEVPKKDAASR